MPETTGYQTFMTISGAADTRIVNCFECAAPLDGGPMKLGDTRVCANGHRWTFERVAERPPS